MMKLRLTHIKGDSLDDWELRRLLHSRYHTEINRRDTEETYYYYEAQQGTVR